MGGTGLPGSEPDLRVRARNARRSVPRLNGVQEVASSNLAAPIDLSDGYVNGYGRAVFLVICNSDRSASSVPRHHNRWPWVRPATGGAHENRYKGRGILPSPMFVRV